MSFPLLFFFAIILSPNSAKVLFVPGTLRVLLNILLPSGKLIKLLSVGCPYSGTLFTWPSGVAINSPSSTYANEDGTLPPYSNTSVSNSVLSSLNSFANLSVPAIASLFWNVFSLIAALRFLSFLFLKAPIRPVPRVPSS